MSIRDEQIFKRQAFSVNSFNYLSWNEVSDYPNTALIVCSLTYFT